LCCSVTPSNLFVLDTIRSISIFPYVYKTSKLLEMGSSYIVEHGLPWKPVPTDGFVIMYGIVYNEYIIPTPFCTPGFELERFTYTADEFIHIDVVIQEEPIPLVRASSVLRCRCRRSRSSGCPLFRNGQLLLEVRGFREHHLDWFSRVGYLGCSYLVVVVL